MWSLTLDPPIATMPSRVHVCRTYHIKTADQTDTGVITHYFLRVVSQCTASCSALHTFHLSVLWLVVTSHMIRWCVASPSHIPVDARPRLPPNVLLLSQNPNDTREIVREGQQQQKKPLSKPPATEPSHQGAPSLLRLLLLWLLAAYV